MSSEVLMSLVKPRAGRLLVHTEGANSLKSKV